MLKASLKRGQNAVGIFIKTASPTLVEIFGYAGFDYVIIDTEHGPTSIETAENLVRAAQLAGITPIIRIDDNNPTSISKALDIGAQGIQVPQISNRRAAETLVEAARFAPQGKRGVCRYVRAAAYSHSDKFKYFEQSNKDNLIIIHIEGEEGMDNLEQIMLVQGIDVIFIGPYDLSQSLGLTGQVSHPLVIKKIKEIVKKSREAGFIVGTFVENVLEARKYMELGVQYISYSVDVGLIYEASRNIVKEIGKGKVDCD